MSTKDELGWAIPSQVTCQTCHFSIVDNQANRICRRLPPSPAPDGGNGIWPVVSRDDWCGEWIPADVYRNEDSNG